MGDDQLTKHEVEQFFELAGTYDKNDLSRAYRKKVAAFHPDVAAARGLDRDAAEELMVIANNANALLKEMLAASPDGTIACDKAPTAEAWVSRAANPDSNADNGKDAPDNSPSSQSAHKGDSVSHSNHTNRANSARVAKETSRNTDVSDPREEFRETGEIPEHLSRKYKR